MYFIKCICFGERIKFKVFVKIRYKDENMLGGGGGVKVEDLLKILFYFNILFDVELLLFFVFKFLYCYVFLLKVMNS